MMPEILPHQAYPDLFTAAEGDLLASLQETPLRFRPCQRLVRACEPLDHVFYLAEGYVGRYRADLLGRRQFLALQIPGDFIDLPSYALGWLDHDIDSFGPAVVHPVPHRSVTMLRLTRPDMGDKLWRITLIDAAIQRYWIFRIGRLMGRARLANFFAETLVRHYARGLCGLDGCPLPINQTDLAEACGMTPVHANRMMGELRAEGICDFVQGEIRVRDLRALFHTGQFDWDYLYLPPRIERTLAIATGRGTMPEKPAPAQIARSAGE